MTQILLYHFKENAMFYEAKDFLETADKKTLHITILRIMMIQKEKMRF